MKIYSNSFKNGDILPNNQVLNAYGLSGGNVSPQLSFDDIPNNAKSLALVCHDPDAPKENGWYHWLVLNIPINVKTFDEGMEIPYLETLTDFNKTGYDGAAPPVGHGIHHYNFTIYALDVEKLEVSKDMPPKMTEDLIKSHAIESSTITAIYERK